VAEDDGGMSLVTLDGHQVGHAALPRSSPSGWPGVGGGMLTYVEDGVLKGLTADGTVAVVGRVTGWAGGPVIVSPDRHHWMWSASSPPATSRLMLGTKGAPDRLIAELTSEQSGLQPFRWTQAGPTYQRAARGIGGYILFGDVATGPTYRFDVDSGQVKPVLESGDCHLADLAVDGTIACIRTIDRSLSVLAPGGNVFEIALPTPTFNQYGAITFVLNSGAVRLVIGGATGSGPEAERYQMDTVDVTWRQLHQLGPDGLRPAAPPWSWLGDGSLVAYRPARAAGGDPGIYVVDRQGATTKVSSSGAALGVVG